MTTGTGIALFGIWMAPTASLLSKWVGDRGVLLAFTAALAATFLLR